MALPMPSKVFYRNKKILWMACHNPPLKKAKRGEMVLPILSPIPFNPLNPQQYTFMSIQHIPLLQVLLSRGVRSSGTRLHC